VSNFRAGNIVLDIVVVGPEKTIGDIEQRHHSSQLRQKWRNVTKAQQQGLSVLYITPSYGAQCAVLYQIAEMLPDHVLPQQTAPASK